MFTAAAAKVTNSNSSGSARQPHEALLLALGLLENLRSEAGGLCVHPLDAGDLSYVASSGQRSPSTLSHWNAWEGGDPGQVTEPYLNRQNDHETPTGASFFRETEHSKSDRHLQTPGL
mmetsp:Transcript_32163/g.68855  ORF Transcript_32163/g.68855 Transcript_32163/m.68855 type:complete len:118 (+) Transcript_32163:719-1072(+)